MRDSGERCIFGKTAVDATTQTLIPPLLRNGFAAVIGQHRRGMALGLMEFQLPPDVAATKLQPDLNLQPASDYVMWALTVPLNQLAETDEVLGDLPGSELLRVVQSMTKDWHEDIRALVAASDPSEICIVPIRTALAISHWKTTNITLIGDAIHAMSPSGGSGANTALRDAGLLCRQLIAANRGDLPLLQAIHDYEVAMLDYGFAAVRESERSRK